MLYIANFIIETLNKGPIAEVKVSLKELYVILKLFYAEITKQSNYKLAFSKFWHFKIKTM